LDEEKEAKKEGGGKAMTSTEIIICSAFEFVKRPLSLLSNLLNLTRYYP